jgi:hypothetical protein
MKKTVYQCDKCQKEFEDFRVYQDDNNHREIRMRKLAIWLVNTQFDVYVEDKYICEECFNNLKI